MGILEPRCFIRECKNFIGVEWGDPAKGEAEEHLVCKAFPDGIPSEISYGKNKHKRPLKGQTNEVVYERAKRGE